MAKHTAQSKRESGSGVAATGCIGRTGCAGRTDHTGATGQPNRHFPMREVLQRLGEAAVAWRVPAMDMVATKMGDPFRVLVGTVLSLRTRDETTLPALQRLLARAATPQALAVLPAQEVARVIRPVAFYRTKAGQLVEISRQLLEQHGGQVPNQLEPLLALPGVGRKTANLVLGLGFGIPAICVDTHVHRICNRLGALRSATAEETERLLEVLLPSEDWLLVNRTLVAFGQALCTPQSPHCSCCPAANVCRRVGVTRSR